MFLEVSVSRDVVASNLGGFLLERLLLGIVQSIFMCIYIYICIYIYMYIYIYRQLCNHSRLHLHQKSTKSLPGQKVWTKHNEQDTSIPSLEYNMNTRSIYRPVDKQVNPYS